ncbi:hypothetical protein IQ07DRAFT_547546 [Pyrenochaeta sp. DS3sAY3a]|nr:hypothetical protein IQ07DRAFT_547546 [Pyrenochaeta sp. DS3sAY3a]
MARLRKPNPNEPTIFAPPAETRPTRSSPRKVPRDLRYNSYADTENSTLVPKASRRDLRYTSDAESSFLVPRSAPDGEVLTPRKQRILRPVESNSRLLRKLSDESLASPEKRTRERRVRSGTVDTDVDKRERLMYAKSLAKSVMRKQINKSRIDIVADTEVQVASPGLSTIGYTQPSEIFDGEQTEDVETSLCCGDEEEKAQAEASTEEEKSTHAEFSSEDEDDEEPVVDIKQRRFKSRARRVISESDEDDTDFEPGEDAFPLPERVSNGPRTISNWAHEVIDLTSSPMPSAPVDLSQPIRVRTASFAASTRPTTSSSHDALAILTYSPTPTKFRSPRKAPPISRPSTPPLPPASPTKLVSPSKRKPAIPIAHNLRPSLDAFWMPEVVNEWNDRHSPSKPLVSPRKQKWREEMAQIMDGVSLEDSSDEGYESPTISPRKKQTRSPTKQSQSPTKKSQPSSLPEELSVKEIRAQRKDFAERKHATAEAFLAELDSTICSGRIAELSDATGGIKLVWSKTLKTTAGRANWRREQIRIRTGPNPIDMRVEIRHHCSIELAEKVIDDEERLYNVLAHEYCHLATFMISEVRNNPHGAEFKSWGARVTKAFAHKGVEVTTKHSYQIEYKYVWECIACGHAFKRHSKSIDPERHSCGACKGRLTQTKPTPRGAATPGLKREKSEYQVFVKANFARVKKHMQAKGADTQMGKVMEAVAKEYREWKVLKSAESGKQVIDLEAALEDLKI